MERRKMDKRFWDRLTDWVDGDREDRDRTLYIMEHPQRPARYVPPTEEEHAEREQQRLHSFFDLYPLAAVSLCGILTALLLAAVLGMPELGVVPVGTGIAAGSWELELLGESCLLFLSTCGVRVLLRGREADQRVMKSWREIPRRMLLSGAVVGWALLILLTLLLGGIAGGALTGALLALPGLFHRRKMLRCRGYAQAISLLLCVLFSGFSIYAGTNGLRGMEVVCARLLEFSAAMSAACAVYGVCSLAEEHRTIS